jgi:predicted naringenin-chalcone synthase
MMTKLAIAGLGTALPDFPIAQSEVCDWLADRLHYSSRTRRFAERIFRLSKVESRYSVLPDFTDPANSILYRDAPPTLEARMQVFREEGPKLAERACNEALRQAGFRSKDVTHLIMITSTGFYTPGPDADLVKRMNLSSSIERTVVSMGGCSAAFTGFRLARQIVASDANATVLMACLELSSIHLDNDPNQDKIIANSVFGDACGAAVLTGATDPKQAVAFLGNNKTLLDYDGRDLVTWDLKSTGYSISLSGELTPFIKERLADFVSPLVSTLTRGSEDPQNVSSWVVHPGGPSILRTIQIQLGLKETALQSAWEVLRDGGNLSSASILFVLQREILRREVGDEGILLGLGPGLTFEAAAFRLGERAFDQL